MLQRVRSAVTAAFSAGSFCRNTEQTFKLAMNWFSVIGFSLLVKNCLILFHFYRVFAVRYFVYDNHSVIHNSFVRNRRIYFINQAVGLRLVRRRPRSSSISVFTCSDVKTRRYGSNKRLRLSVLTLPNS